MWDFIMKGGVLMYPILLCSVVGLSIVIERTYHFFRAGINVQAFQMLMHQITGLALTSMFAEQLLLQY